MNEIEFFGEEEAPVKEGWKVDALEDAEWCLTKIGRAETEIDRFTIMAEVLKERINARLEEILKKHLGTIETMEILLRPWADVEIAKAGKAKSIKLLNGTIGYRSGQSSLVVNDEVAAVAWLKDHAAGCVRVNEEVKKTETKNFIEENGEIPDGVEMKAGNITFYAKPLPPLLEK